MIELSDEYHQWQMEVLRMNDDDQHFEDGEDSELEPMEFCDVNTL